MLDRTPIDFVGLARALLDRAASLLSDWLPGGHAEGHEFKALNPTRSDSKVGSFSVNLVTGAWADFADGDAKGRDLVSLYAYLQGMNNGQAARQLMRELGWERPVVAPAPQSPPTLNDVPPAEPDHGAKRASTWRAVVPVPPNAPVVNFKHFSRGEPSRHWEYRFNGQLFGYVCRFDTSDGGKEIIPRTWCIDESDERGLQRWHWLQWDAPRPLYVPSAALAADAQGVPVVLVEGEKCAQAGHDLLGAEFDFVSWPGGGNAWAKADWSWLRGRTVYLWPDCDAKRGKLSREEREAGVDPAAKPLLPENKQPGMRAMVSIGSLLAGQMECTVLMCSVPAPGAVADGWDIADAIAQGWDAAQVRAFIRGAKAFVPPDEAVRAKVAGSGSTPASAGAGTDSAANAWRGRLLLAGNGAIKPVRENIVLALDGMPGILGMDETRGVIGFNEFTNDVVKLRAAPWRTPAGAWAEVDELLMGEWLVQVPAMPSAPRATLEEVVRMVAYRHRYHPVRAYLQSLKWDGVKRLSTWLSRACLAEDEWDNTDPLQQYLARVGTWFLMGMCSRVLDPVLNAGTIVRGPGVKFDYMLILEGAQGMRKSTLLRVLAGEYFADTGLVLGDKDSYQQLQGRWLYEFGELDSFGKAEVTKIKSFVASASDYFRASFDRRARDYPRQVVFGGTTNEDHYLTDPTGNRRFWPVRVTRHIDIDWVISVRDQLFAEAVQRVLEGARMYPTSEEELELFEPQQRQRQVENAIESAVGKYLYEDLNGQLLDEVSLVEVLGKIGIGIEKLGPGRYHEKQAASALRRMGWPQRKSSRPGRPIVYVRPAGSKSSTPTQGNNDGGSDDCPF